MMQKASVKRRGKRKDTHTLLFSVTANDDASPAATNLICPAIGGNYIHQFCPLVRYVIITDLLE